MASISGHLPKQNASTARTRERIRKAFLQIAESVDFANITVNMVTKHAGLNRTTFYLHFATIDDLAASLVDEMVEELSAGDRFVDLGISIGDPEWHESYFNYINSRPALFRRLLANPGSSPLSGRVRSMLLDSVRHHFRQQGLPVDTSPEVWDVRVRFAASGIYGVTMHWLDTGMAESTESICARCLEMMMLIPQAKLTPAL